MLKRSISVLLAMVCLFVFAGSALAATAPTQPVPLGVPSSINAQVVVVNNKVTLQMQGYAPYYVKGDNTKGMEQYPGRFMWAEGVLSVNDAGTFTYTISRYGWLPVEQLVGTVLTYGDDTVRFRVGENTYAISGIYGKELQKYLGRPISATVVTIPKRGEDGLLYYTLLGYKAIDPIYAIGKLNYLNKDMTQITFNKSTYGLIDGKMTQIDLNLDTYPVFSTITEQLKPYSGKYVNVTGQIGGMGGQGRQDFCISSYSLVKTTSGSGTVKYYNDQMTQITINNSTYAVTGPLTSQLKQYNGKKIKVTGVLGGIGGQGRQDFYLLEYSL